MQPIDLVTLSRLVQSSAQDVFATMLGIDLSCGEPYIEHAPPDPTEGVVSLIGLAGQWVGTGCVFCSADFACRVSRLMLMTEIEAVGEDVLDAVAELTNMILGNVKTGLEDHLGPMGLSIPTVVFGKNFTARSAGDGEWNVFPFFHGGDRMEVKLYLIPGRKPAHIRMGYSHPYPLQG
jgi:chemotaxis protein CheX